MGVIYSAAQYVNGMKKYVEDVDPALEIINCPAVLSAA
jgi:hypothetical protein